MKNNKASILVIDDAQENIDILHAGLRNTYTVMGAPSGEIALKMIKASPPDLILLDIVMPGIDGYELCQLLKQDEETQNIPIIFVSAKDNEKDEEYGLKLGAVDYVRKPFSLPIIHARVTTHVKLKQATDQLSRLASYDGLTGIANRRSFDENLNKMYHSASRLQHWLSIMLIDLDHFKGYNDHYGHLQGDDCLTEVGRLLSQQFSRSTEFVARYGGEEFVVLLTSDSPEEGQKAARRLLQATRDLCLEHKANSVADNVTMSIGVAAAIPAIGVEPSQLLEAADKQLYNAKDKGRDQIQSIVLHRDYQI